jgi:hypothetical protein
MAGHKDVFMSRPGPGGILLHGPMGISLTVGDSHVYKCFAFPS